MDMNLANNIVTIHIQVTWLIIALVIVVLIAFISKRGSTMTRDQQIEQAEKCLRDAKPLLAVSGDTSQNIGVRQTAQRRAAALLDKGIEIMKQHKPIVQEPTLFS